MEISEKIINSKAADSVLSTSAKDDFRQAFAVCNNELIKYRRSKKVVIYAVLAIGLLAMNICINLFTGDNTMQESLINASRGALGFCDLILLIMATIFASSSIVSEYEERTALILLTKPIKKTSILAGKYLASLIVGLITIVIIYATSVILLVAGGGDLKAEYLVSFLMASLSTLMLSSIAVAVSAFSKKASTAAMLVLFIVMIFSLIVGGILQSNGIDSWWMFLSLTGSINGVLDGDYETGRAAIMMVVWTVAGLLAAQQIFKRRQF